MSWHIENIRDVQWYDGGPFGVYGDFERGGERFPEVGFNFGLIWPGQKLGMYHREENQEGFLVLSGECLLIVEGEEHPLRQWDYFHCPAGVDHIIVGAGDGPAFLIAVGGRTGSGGIVYPVDAVAQKHDATVERETTDPKEAYARFPKQQTIPFDEEWLP
ncbi:MAG TPA: cupin domain-containing protein [Gaiellaceae bacterium]|jgi:uncharacterized cupin superfamily protein